MATIVSYPPSDIYCRRRPKPECSGVCKTEFIYVQPDKAFMIFKVKDVLTFRTYVLRLSINEFEEFLEKLKERIT